MTTPDDLQVPDPNPVELSHLQRERHVQAIRRQLKVIRTEHLRLLRAWLLDVVQGERTAHLELATLRGELIHAEVERRERDRLRTRLSEFGLVSSKPIVDQLASFPDLAAP